MALTKTPIELSSTPGIVDNSNATAITIDASENVTLAGTATMNGLTVTSSSSNAGTFKAVGGYALQAYQDATSANHTALELRSDHVSGGTDRYLIRGYNTAAGTPVESFNVNTAGGAYFAGGAFLGGTAAAHKLDDYEEVNFTATIRGSLAEPATLITATGYATRIGRVVQYSIGFEAVNTTGYSGIVTITGLPFTNNGGRAIGNLVGYRGLAWGGSDCFSVIQMNGTNIEGFSISSASVWAEATHNGDSSAYFWLTGTYMTTA